MRTSKKILAFLLASLLFVTGLPAFAVEAEPEAFAEVAEQEAISATETIYVSADGVDTNDGASDEAPVGSFDKALELAATQGATRIVIMSALSTELYSWPEHEHTITVTAKDGDTVYDGALVFESSVLLGGDFVFENILKHFFVRPATNVDNFAFFVAKVFDEFVCTMTSFTFFTVHERVRETANVT